MNYDSTEIITDGDVPTEGETLWDEYNNKSISISNQLSGKDQITILPQDSGFIVVIGTGFKTRPKLLAFSDYEGVTKYLQENQIMDKRESEISESI